MSNEIKLLICPCCKAKAYTDRIGNPLFTIRCTNIKCGLKVSKPTLKEAVDAWNTRKPMDSIIELLEKESDFFSGKPMGSLQKAYYCKGVNKAINMKFCGF